MAHLPTIYESYVKTDLIVDRIQRIRFVYLFVAVVVRVCKCISNDFSLSTHDLLNIIVSLFDLSTT